MIDPALAHAAAEAEAALAAGHADGYDCMVAALGRDNPIAQALYFTRARCPAGSGPHFHHIGIYAYRRAALQRFVQLPPGKLEQWEKLEQLRALAAGMRIDVALVDMAPFGVDTPADLERARALLKPPKPAPNPQRS